MVCSVAAKRSIRKAIYPCAVLFLVLASCSSRVHRNEEPLLAIPNEPRKVMPLDAGPDTLPINDFESSFFDFDRAVLRPGAKKALRETAVWLRKNRGVKLQIEGFCDARGSVEYNLRLGQRRAEAVLENLVANGIDRDRMSALSYGRLPGEADQVRAQNRRVSVIAIFPNNEEASKESSEDSGEEPAFSVQKNEISER